MCVEVKVPVSATAGLTHDGVPARAAV